MVISETKMKELLNITGSDKPEVIDNIAKAIGGKVGDARTYVSPKSFQAAIIGNIAIEPSVKKAKDGSYKVNSLSFWSREDGSNIAFINKKYIRELVY